VLAVSDFSKTERVRWSKLRRMSDPSIPTLSLPAHPEPRVTVGPRSVRCEIDVHASPERVFALWADVAHWHTWDPDTQWARIDGPFAPGTRGKIKSKQPLAAAMLLTSVQPGLAFTARVSALATHMDFEHHIERISDERVRVVHTARFSGWLAGLFMKQIGKPLASGLPITLRQLKALAEVQPPF
jgi:uncharacterized protein YndB with AHSA1/START domain